MLLTWKSGAKLQIRKNITKFIWHFLLAFSTVNFKGIERAVYEFYFIFFRQNHVGLCRLCVGLKTS